MCTIPSASTISLTNSQAKGLVLLHCLEHKFSASGENRATDVCEVLVPTPVLQTILETVVLVVFLEVLEIT